MYHLGYHSFKLCGPHTADVIDMTAQIGDTVVYENRDFSLAGINGDGLFDPVQSGLKVATMSTACWNGFYCTYTVIVPTITLRRTPKRCPSLPARFAKRSPVHS